MTDQVREQCKTCGEEYAIGVECDLCGVRGGEAAVETFWYQWLTTKYSSWRARNGNRVTLKLAFEFAADYATTQGQASRNAALEESAAVLTKDADQLEAGLPKAGEYRGLLAMAVESKIKMLRAKADAILALKKEP